MFGDSNQPPNRIVINGKMIDGSKKMASKLNRFFINKIEKIRKEIPVTNNDQLTKFKENIRKPKKDIAIQYS